MKKYTFSLLLFCLISNVLPSVAQTKATIYTTMGNIVLDLYDTLQPITTNNFKTLVNNKFYDGIIFHRVINNFMIQGGCPFGNGTGGPGYTILDEFDPNTSNIQKTISMANSGPNTGGSQFFINLVNNTYLNPNHPVFGIVSANFSVVQNIGLVATDANDKPLNNVTMDSIRITAYPTATTDLQATGKMLFEIFPNPATSQSVLKIQTEQPASVQISITDIYGQLLMQRTHHLNTGITALPFNEMNLDRLTAGIYFFSVKSQESVYTQKIFMSH
ncbi:MAG: peptidylprolyl isomerase [Chitinophagaceae bacterium]|nr:peptidylprolyl isomerase [Chitinophagaceae bacterium]